MSVQIHPCLQLRQPPNLRNKLISRKLPSNPDVTNNGSKPCNKKRCKLCNQINPSKSVSDTQKGSSVFFGSYSCTSNNVVYLIQCRKCSKGSYVGEKRP
ncbi:unnamed protein product, partial [Staurois parvus]